MVTPANAPPGTFAPQGRETPDPFYLSAQDAKHQRYSAFDASQSSIYLSGSPSQAKRALEAHLTETNRRLQEASVLGKSLVQQKQELEDRLKEVGEQQTNNDIGPELRQRLAELEKEFNEVGRETARAFLPKSRVPSGESDVTGSASIYSSEAHASPSKVSVPSRKQRNQQPSRINDIALATEISTSLLTQLKELQALLAEKDETLKAANLDKSLLELENEGLSQRVRNLDESESRLKDVNWNLETQVRELEAAAKASADRENRINHSLNLARTDKSTVERELEELKQLYTKLNDDHVSKTKHHEVELSGLRRDMATAETERGALQRKVDELTVQNQELAKAAAYRMRAEEQKSSEEISPDDAGGEGDAMTPDESPPPSPNKATPRHGQLESETLKHSLHHAHRMIQQLKNNIHREKTEKLELKRMLQDARDDLETTRNEAKGLSSASKRRKNDKDVFKKPPRPDRLGAYRTGKQEVVDDDDEWEEPDEIQNTPSKRSRNREAVPGAFPGDFSSAADTSTETEAFETANEREGTATETDAFQTGAETLDGDSTDDLTETEGMSTIRARRSPLSIVGNRNSYQSTASTSGDEADDMTVTTPNQLQHPRYKLKMRQSGYRRSDNRGSLDNIFNPASPPPEMSPASVSNSNRSTPAHGRSLFAELGGFSGAESEDGSFVEGTPARSSLLSPDASPEATRRSVVGKSPLQAAFVPKPTTVMVDSETMTDAWEPETPPTLGLSDISTSIDTEPQAPVQRPLNLSSLQAQEIEPKSVPQPPLHLSQLSMQWTEPQPAEQRPLDMSAFIAQETAPLAAPMRPLQISAVSAQDTAPVPIPAHSLHISTVTGQETAPISMPVRPLHMSTGFAQDTSPVHLPPRTMNLSAISRLATEPTEPVGSKEVRLAPVLMPSVSAQATEPLEPEPAQRVAVPTGPATETTKRFPLRISSSLSRQATQPLEPTRPKPTLSAIFSQATEALEPRGSAPPQFSVHSSQSTSPVEASRPALSHSAILSHLDTSPVEAPKPADLQLSSPAYQATAPVEALRQRLTHSAILALQDTSPVEAPRPAELQFSSPTYQATAPVEPTVQVPQSQFSSIVAENTSPIGQARLEQNFSDVMVVHDVQPESPTLPSFLPNPSRPSTANRMTPPLSLSPISSRSTEPFVPSRPVTAHRDVPNVSSAPSATPHTQPNGIGSVLGVKLDFSVPTTSWTADVEDPMAQSASQGHKRPMSRATQTSTVDEGTQTMVSANQIDRLLTARSAQRQSNALATGNIERHMSPPASPRKDGRPRRLSSSSSVRSRGTSPPPLPPDHKEVIAAAALKTPSLKGGVHGEMGPPAVPASAYKRPQTPTVRPPSVIASQKTDNGTTPRARPQPSRSTVGRSDASSPITRHSSVSSFASDVERRLNPGANPFGQGFDMNTTDPRMIQAITQTMIGEFLWKYTRKTGREGMSQTRHRRFFWVHPYTRTLYWSEQDPATAGRTQLKAKSVAIQAVQVVTDDNPYPPGLHRKSIVIITPGRTIKFTATTGQRHETWYNALSYLLLRTADGEQEDSPSEIQDEFNPAFRSTSRQTNRSRTSSFFSHRTSSPFGHRANSPQHSQVPTLRRPVTPSRRGASDQSQESGRFSSLSGFIRPSSALRNSFTSVRKRTSQQNVGTMESPSKNSAYDFAEEMIVRSVDNSAHVPAMENVRACCDGKHDVGHLHSHDTQKSRHNSYNILTVGSRSHSRTSQRKD